jgi:hypothetical protein
VASGKFTSTLLAHQNLFIDLTLRTVLNHFTKKSFHRKFLTERPFDRNTIWPNTVWPNAIWPKVHLTESPFNRRPFDRKFILPKKVIWPKILEKRVRNDIWSKVHLTKSFFFRKMVIWPKSHLTESWKRMLFFEKWSFARNFSWQNIKQPWFIIKIGKAILIVESANDQNRVGLPRCLRHRYAPCPRWKYKIQLKFPMAFG